MQVRVRAERHFLPRRNLSGQGVQPAGSRRTEEGVRDKIVLIGQGFKLQGSKKGKGVRVRDRRPFVLP